MKRALLFLILAGQVQGAITFLNVGTVTSSGNALTVAQPATPAANDIWIMVVQSANEAITTPTNATAGTWAEIITQAGAGTAATAGSARLGIYWLRWTTATGNVSLADTGNHQIAQIAAYRGCKTSGNPWNVASASIVTSTTTSTILPTALQTTVADCWMLVAMADSQDNTTSSMDLTVQGGDNVGTRNSRIRTNIATGTGGGIGLADATVTATATNTNIWIRNTISAPPGGNFAYGMVALEPFTATPTPTPGPNTGAFLPFFAPGWIWLKSWFL